MSDSDTLKHYSPAEEKTNIISHALGLALSMVALVLMVIRASQYGNMLQLVSVSIFGVSLIALYAASTFYHSATDVGLRTRLRIIDHATIYVLIAGTYTPLTLIALGGPVGWVIFGASWAMAVTGISLKVFFTGRFDLISTLMYIFMGWIIVFAIKPLMDNMSSEGLFWLFAGGVAYTTGAILYSIKKIPFNHAVFHLFVLLGSFCHFVSVYLYVLPGR
jgi:hemolysin III